MKWLNEFIDQSFDGNLKTSQYPREFGPYKMKVSFGQGMPARVPWISFFASGMSTSNGYYPVYLHYKDQSKLILAFGISETNQYEKSWTEEVIGNSPKIKDSVENPPRYGESWVFKSYDVIQTNMFLDADPFKLLIRSSTYRFWIPTMCLFCQVWMCLRNGF
jgi:5-methylcytosine-specific restriction protein B